MGDDTISVVFPLDLSFQEEAEETFVDRIIIIYKDTFCTLRTNIPALPPYLPVNRGS